MELTLSEVRELIVGPGASNNSKHTVTGQVFPQAPATDPQKGECIIIRTVTMTLVGEVTVCGNSWIMLDNASWVADSGQWGAAIANGTLNEVEYVGDDVRVARAAVVDITPWRHELPTESK